MATDLLHPRNGTTVLRVGVAYLAKALVHYPALAGPFVSALLALPGDVRARLLNLDGPKDELPVSRCCLFVCLFVCCVTGFEW